MIVETTRVTAHCDGPGCTARVEMPESRSYVATVAPPGWGFARAMSRTREGIEDTDVHLLCPECSDLIPLFLREGVVPR